MRQSREDGHSADEWQTRTDDIDVETWEPVVEEQPEYVEVSVDVEDKLKTLFKDWPAG